MAHILPPVLPKWDWALNSDDAFLMKQWESKIIRDALDYAKGKGWVNIYFNHNTKEISYKEGEHIGQASADNANINDLRRIYAIKFL